MHNYEESSDNLVFREDALLATLDSLVITYGKMQEDKSVVADLMPASPVVRFKDKQCLQIEYRSTTDKNKDAFYILRNLAVSNIIPVNKSVINTRVLRTFGTLIYEPKFMFRPNTPFSLDEYEPLNDTELRDIQQHVLRYGSKPYIPNSGESVVQSIGSFASKLFSKS